jgi:stage III sporulation protein AD
MDIVKIAFMSVLTVLVYSLLRQIKPEIAPLIVLAGIGLIFFTLADGLLGVTDTVGEMMALAGLEKENVSLLLRALAICVVSQFAADICYDNSCSSIGSAVELAGRIGAVTLAMPMIKTVARIAIGLING